MPPKRESWTDMPAFIKNRMTDADREQVKVKMAKLMHIMGWDTEEVPKTQWKPAMILSLLKETYPRWKDIPKERMTTTYPYIHYMNMFMNRWKTKVTEIALRIEQWEEVMNPSSE